MYLIPLSSSAPDSTHSEDPEVKALCEKLRRLRRDQAAWHEASQSFMAEHDALVLSHQKQFVQNQLTFLAFLEHHLQTEFLSHHARYRVDTMICLLIERLMTMPLPDNQFDALVVVFDRHSPRSYDDLQRERTRAMAGTLGIDMSGCEALSGEDHDARLKEEVLRVAQEAFDELYGFVLEDTDHGRMATAEKSPRMRELYRFLVRFLHPDREPDPQRRDEKTVLMQRLNDAYRCGDMLGMLNLHVEAGLMTQHEVNIASSQFREELISSIQQQCEDLRGEISLCKEQIQCGAGALCPLPKRLTVKSLKPALKFMKNELDLIMEELDEMIEELPFMVTRELIDELEALVTARP